MSKKRVWLYVLGAIVVASIGPIIINECYKKGAGYVTMWDAKDMLNYYGMIVGSAVTMAGLVVTIQFTRKQIRRESFLKSEGDKWANAETVVSNILNEISPIPTLKHIMSVGFIEPGTAINSLQKYQMTCRLATDQLCAYLNTEDLSIIKGLVDQIADVAEKFVQVCQEEVDQSSKLHDLQSRKIALELISIEEQHPGSLSAEEILRHQETIKNTNNIDFDDVKTTLGGLNGEIIRIYEIDFRSLLQLKGAAFETINTQMRKRADAILSLRRK